MDGGSEEEEGTSGFMTRMVRSEEKEGTELYDADSMKSDRGGDLGLYGGWKGLAASSEEEGGSRDAALTPASAGQEGWYSGWSWGDLLHGTLGATPETTGRVGGGRQPRLRGNPKTEGLC